MSVNTIADWIRYAQLSGFARKLNQAIAAGGGAPTGNAVLTSLIVSGSTELAQRPSWATFTPWDNQNLDPTTFMLKADPLVVGGLTVNGVATFESRPTFGAATPWDTGNFDPSDYVLKTLDPVVIDGLEVQGTATFASRPTFNGNAPWDTGNFTPANYLTTADAATTYETVASAVSTYQPINTAVTLQQLATKANSANPVLTGTVQVEGGVTIDAPPGVWKPITFNSNGHQRFQWGVDNSGETGNNVGSNFSGFRYADNGAVLGQSLSINRATGAWLMEFRPTWQGYTPWDSNNFDPSLYLTTAVASQTYTTPAEVNAALATFRTLSNSNFSNQTAGNSAIPALILTGGDNSTVEWFPQATAQLANQGLFPLNTVVQAGDAALIALRAAGSLASLTIGVGSTNAPSAAGIRFNVGNGGVATIGLGVRPTFAGSLAWDAGNFNPANYLTTADATTLYETLADLHTNYLTSAAAAAKYATISGVQSAYMPFSGGTFTGGVQFNQMPTINGTPPVVTDSSADIATTSWVQAVITSRVGTNGPYIPTSGVGMPYDIAFPYQGTSVPAVALPSAYAVLVYTFARKVTLPINFAGSKVSAINRATAATSINMTRSGSVTAGVGTMNFAANATVATFSVAAAQTFLPGDTLTIVTGQSAGNAAVADATLAGLSGVLAGTMVA